jgi:hypothetical protein
MALKRRQASRSQIATLKSGPAAEYPNRPQIATGSQKHRGPRLPPYAFTEHGAIRERYAVFFGRASSCENPVMIRFNDRQDFLRLFRPAEPQRPAAAPERASAAGEPNVP